MTQTQDFERAIDAVQVFQVAKLFGATPALRNASADFRAGTITLLSGANGAGKSTLLAIVGTRLRPTRGLVQYSAPDGLQLTRREVRARLGWVSHESQAYGELSGRQNVELVADLQGAPRVNVDEVLDRLAVGRFAERPVGTLSRGQRQRIALARALVHRPGLLLLDEPWTGLDAKSSHELERIVLEERARGALIVVVSHEPGLAERLGARELRIAAGRIESA